MREQKEHFYKYTKVIIINTMLDVYAYCNKNPEVLQELLNKSSIFILWSDLQKTIRLHTSSGMNLGEMSVEVKGAMN